MAQGKHTEYERRLLESFQRREQGLPSNYENGSSAKRAARNKYAEAFICTK